MDSWNRFLRDIDRAMKRCEKNGRDVPLFRGHGRCRWRLVPGLGRPRLRVEDMRMRENLLYSDFSAYAGATKVKGLYFIADRP
jgi:hypothetical protein